MSPGKHDKIEVGRIDKGGFEDEDTAENIGCSLCFGVVPSEMCIRDRFLVSTASHGGTMVANEVAAVLSPAAKKCGFKDKGYICYEEDAQESVVLRELLDKKLWKIPDRIKNKGQFEEKLNQSIRQYHPEYWRARQSGREAAEAARSTAPAKEAAR